MEQAKSVFTIKEISRLYGFPEFGLRGLVKTKKIPVIQCGNRSYITRANFEMFLQKGGS